MRFLITGSTGFIGSKLVEELESQSISFDVLKRKTAGSQSIQKEGVVEIQWPGEIQDLELKNYTSIIHLANAPATPQATVEELERDNLSPVKYFLERISATNPDCSFVFVSSQSAKAETPSIYGKLKWEAEELVRKHQSPWTIIRPGLVIGHEGKGLFNRILGIVEKLPVIPLVGSGDQLLQPVGVDEVVESLIVTAKNGQRYNKKEYAIVGHTITFKDFLSQSAQILGKKRLFVPIPLSLINFGFTILEAIVPNPPITKTNLLGLLNFELLDSKVAFEELGIKLPEWNETLEKALGMNQPLTLQNEAKFLYNLLFKKRPGELLVERYITAHDYCCFPENEKQQIKISEIFRSKLDAEAIEYATRSRKTLLTKKLTLILYLAELESKNYSDFINEKSSFIKGFILLGLAVLRAPWKLLKGKYLVWRYQLV
jgi:nucleoside-diphosphate-sugar epimerase